MLVRKVCCIHGLGQCSLEYACLPTTEGDYWRSCCVERPRCEPLMGAKSVEQSGREPQQPLEHHRPDRCSVEYFARILSQGYRYVDPTV